MTRQTKPVAGVHAPGPRLTPLGAAILAAMIAVPAGLIIGLLDWALR